MVKSTITQLLEGGYNIFGDLNFQQNGAPTHCVASLCNFLNGYLTENVLEGAHQ